MERCFGEEDRDKRDKENREVGGTQAEYLHRGPRFHGGLKYACWISDVKVIFDSKKNRVCKRAETQSMLIQESEGQ